MNPETTSLASWLLGLLATGVVAVLGFLIKKAFNDTTTAVIALSAKFDVMTAAQARGEGDVRELRAQHQGDVRELKSEITALKDRLARVEQVQRESA